MKQSTSFAQGATNLLNVLQWYIKSIRFVVVLTMLLIVSIGQAWGTEVKHTCSGISGTILSSKITFSTTSATWNSPQCRIAAKGSIAFTLTGVSVTKIAMGFSSSGYVGSWTSSAGGSFTTNSTTVTWNGSANPGIPLTFTTSSEARLKTITVTYETAAAHTVTWTINPAAGGNLSATSGNTTTVTPDAAYTYDSPAYTVTPAGNANVSQDGDNFTATPSANCTIQINMVAKPKYTVNWYVNGIKEHSQTDIAGTPLTKIPNLEDYECGGKVFVGWTIQSSYEHATDAPNGLITNTTGMTIPENGEDYYAVFANVETTHGETTTKWVETDIASIASNDEVVITMSKSETTWALRDDNGTSKAPVAEVVTIENGQVTSTIVENMIWIIEKSNNNLTLYKDNEKSNWLYCTKANDGVRVGTNTNKFFTVSGNYLKHTETSRYVGVYIINPDWRCYDNTTGNIAGQTLAFYKKTTTSGYQNYTTSCSTEPSKLAKPTGLNVTNITSTSATLSWDAVANASSYTVSVYGENDEVIAEYSGLTETTKNVDGLSTKTNYIFGVVAVGDGSTYLNSDQATSEVFTTSSATCTVTYDANGGIGTPPSDTKVYTNGATVTVLANYGKLTKDGYAFTGWNTQADGNGTTYRAGEKFTISANTTLYAQWCKAYWKLVTDAAELENDTRIVIAAKDEAVALSTTQNTNNRGQAAITKKYNTVTFGADVQTLSLMGLPANLFALYTGTGFLYAAGSDSYNYLKTGSNTNGNGNWDITISQGAAKILAQGTNKNNQLKYNSTRDLFSCYGSTNSQEDVVIYKEVCVQDQYYVNEPKLTNATAVNTNPTNIASNATQLKLNYSANTGFLLPETITVKMGSALLVATTDYTWDKATGALTINVTGFYGDIDVKIVAEADPCYGFEISTVNATSTTPNSVTLTWTEVTGATGYNVKLGTGEFTAANGLTHTFEGLTPKTTYKWEVQAVNGTCQASQTGSITTQKETFTVSWVVNGNTTDTESVVDGNKITKYPNDLSAPSGCREKVFVGWTDNPINTPTDKVPATLYKQKSDVPAITGNTTLYAVFATAIGGGSGNYELVESDPSDWSGTYLIVDGESKKCFDGSLTTLDANGNYQSVEINDKTITSNTTTDSYSVTISKSTTNGKYYIQTASGYYIGSDASTASADNELDSSTSTRYDNSISINSNNVTIKGPDHILKFFYQSGQSWRFRYFKSSSQNVRLPQLYKKSGGTTYSAYTTLCDECTPSTLTLEADNTTADLDINGEATIAFSITGGNGGAITYVATPKTGVTWDNGTATFTKAGEYTITASQEKNGENCPTTSNSVNVTITAIPHLYFVTEPANPIVFDAVECGGNTALTNKKSVELQGYNLTGNVTATVTGAYKIARTSSATLGEYSTSLTLDKNNEGKINGNYDIVYVLSCPPAGGTASTEGKLTFTTEAGNTLTVNLSTPTVTCTQRTLTFNDRGNTTTQEYYAGAEVPQPEDPTGVCTIPVNYVFDGWAEAEVTNGSTSYTKVNFPYSMPAKNTTLYAVYRYTEDNANSDKFMSVDKELGELVSGMDYVLTGYYDSEVHSGDDNEYAMSITAYETGKYKTKFVDVQESSILYEEGIPYYEFTTTDNEIIWTIEGDEVNGYTFQNKSNNKYLAVSADKLTLSDNAAKFTIEHETGVDNNGEEVYYMSLVIQPVGSTKYLSSYYKDATAGVLFNLHTTSTLSLYLYKRVASNLYTTSPDCGGIAITYDFAGGDGGHCTDTRVEGGSNYTICDEAPTKEGYTFLHWSDGVNTYNPSDVIENVTADITLTAQWQIKTYTVTWSNNGDPTPVEYNHGVALVVPEAPESCDGVKEFVGWTEQSGYYHATTAPTDLFKTTTATVTADKTYYAVFATRGEGSANFVLGESGTFKMYANVNGTNYYAQGGVSSNKITSTTEAANASDYTLTYADGSYTIKQGTSNVGNKTGDADLNTNETTWTISEGTNGSWRVTSNVSTSRALSYNTSTSAFKAYATSNIESGSCYDIEFGGTSSGYSDYTTTCQQVESIEVQSPQTEFYITNDFTIGSGKVIATLSGGGTTDVTALATFSGYNMNVVGTYTVTVTYMGATATYNINVKPLDNAWVLTWNVSGKTNTGLGPRSVTKGSAIGTLPTPEVPAACEGKTFMGWTTSNIVHSDGTGITYITPETVPTDNTTYYAVFATINNFSVQKPIDQIASGSKVVIVAVASLTDDGGAGKAISSRATDDAHNLQGDDVAIYDQTINTPHSTCIWTITKSGEKYIFTQDGKYLNGIISGKYSNLKYNGTSDSWTLTPAASGMAMTYNMKSTNASTEYVEWFNGKFTIHNEVNTNGAFDMQFFVTANAEGNADITDYTTGCEEYTITYYGFRGGYSTSTSSDGIIVLPVNSLHTVPNCGDVVKDHTNLGREFLDVWMTQPHGGHTFKPGDTFILTQDTTLYAQWKMETTSDVTTLPTDIEDMAGTDIYVYGGKTLNIQPGTTTINSLTLKGGLQADGSYKMPTVWVPEGATLVRNSNKIYLDLVVNAKNYYPFAVPFATKNNANVEYLDPILAAASTYGKHFVIKTYDGARRAKQGEDRANNWVKVLRDETLQPGVGYIITALTYPTKDTATIRIPMTVPNTWFNNGEQAEVGTTVRNTIAVTAHAGAAATEHPRHAGWNFVANPYLTSFAGGNVANDGGLAYINGELTVNGGWQYGGDEVPYVTIPAYDFSYYTQHKLSDVKLSPEWSFFVQIGTSGTMDFSTAGRQETPASISSRHDAAQSIRMDVDIILSDKHHSDQTGIIISDRFTSAYEIGRDLEKLFGSAFNLSVYTLMEDNTPLAYQALAIHSNMQVIPVGYRAPEQGEYTFRLNEATSSIDLLNEQYEQLILVDYETGALTNLLNSSYTFTSPRTQSNSRFAIYAVMRQGIPTDLPNIYDGDTSTRKILHNGHLYILRDGKVYNGHGQIVKQ